MPLFLILSPPASIMHVRVTQLLALGILARNFTGKSLKDDKRCLDEFNVVIALVEMLFLM